MLNGVWEEIGEAYNIVFLVPDFAPKTLAPPLVIKVVEVK